MQAREGIQTIMPLKYLIPLIIIVEGFASIAIEILTIRQLLPVAGGSVVVTSLIIGIFLLFLALGYEKGGRVQHDLHRVLRRNFLIAGIWSGIGLSYIFITYFFALIQSSTGPHIVYPLTAYLVAVLAPSIYWLGQTLPIIMNIVKQNHSAGVIAGKALGLSTVGSFLGAVLTTLILMYYLGVAWTVVIVFLSLILLAVLLSQTATTSTILLGVIAVATFFVYYLNVGVERSLFLLTNNYANYRILDSGNSKLKDGQKILVINETLSSFTDNKHNAFRYIEVLRKLIYKDLNLKHANILVLGAGGFTLTNGQPDVNKVTYVDIDKRIKDVVVPGFLDKIKDKIIIDDARNFLNNNTQQYDVIITDVLSDYKAIPAHLLTHEFMLTIKKHLTPDGHAMFNIIANPMFTDPYSKRINNTIRSVFGACVVVPVDYHNSVTNLVYACANNSRKQDKVVYVDNLNNSTTDSFEW